MAKPPGIKLPDDPTKTSAKLSPKKPPPKPTVGGKAPPVKPKAKQTPAPSRQMAIGERATLLPNISKLLGGKPGMKKMK